MVGVVCARAFEGGGDQVIGRHEVGQPGNAALARARTKGDQDGRLAAQQPGEMEVLRRADAAREQRQVDRAVVHLLDVGVLGVHDGRPEDDLEMLGEVEDRLAEVDDADVAAAARRCPVHREAVLARGAHASPPRAQAPSVAISDRSAATSGTRPQASGPERSDLVDDARERVGQLLSLCRARVDALEALRFDAQADQHAAQQLEAAQRLDVLDPVVAVLRPAAGHDHGVSAALEGT